MGGANHTKPRDIATATSPLIHNMRAPFLSLTRPPFPNVDWQVNHYKPRVIATAISAPALGVRMQGQYQGAAYFMGNSLHIKVRHP